MSRQPDDATETLSASAVRLDEPRALVILEGQVTAHLLGSRAVATIGRGEDCPVRIEHASVSRVHAVLHLGEQGATIGDAGSRNGTLVRGQRLGADTRVVLQAGEAVQIGAATVILQGRLSKEGAAATVRAPLDAVAAVHELLDRVAPTDLNVLILGETGCGKGVLAERLHKHSNRASGPFLGLNCCALSEPLLGSELFGHERGAFTGAVAAKPGLLEVASGGTVLLDEIGELSETIQVKLLRVLEERVVWRVGALKPRPLDVRFVAATNRNLRADIAQGRFRADLYFRLNGVTLRLPPLRERRAEIPALAEGFLRGVAGDRLAFSERAMSMLGSHDWPGNIRELRNVVERAAAVVRGTVIGAEDLLMEAPAEVEARAPGEASMEPGSKATDEAGRITDALAQCGGNQSRAAVLLGISRATLVRRLDELGLVRPRKR